MWQLHPKYGSQCTINMLDFPDEKNSLSIYLLGTCTTGNLNSSWNLATESGSVRPQLPWNPKRNWNGDFGSRVRLGCAMKVLSLSLSDWALPGLAMIFSLHKFMIERNHQFLEPIKAARGKRPPNGVWPLTPWELLDLHPQISPWAGQFVLLMTSGDLGYGGLLLNFQTRFMHRAWQRVDTRYLAFFFVLQTKAVGTSL